MRVFRSRAEAEAAGYQMVLGSFPWRATRGRYAPSDGPPVAIVRTDLEAKLAEALEAVEWGGPGDMCPACPGDGELTPFTHAPGCTLAAALKKFRGE